MKFNNSLKDQLIDWYWNYGCQRTERFSLSRGGWLDRALRIASEGISVDTARNTYDKPTMALWGPSQSGKSTFLARFIDEGIETGYGSALSWDAGVMARFSGDNEGGTVAVLNPYNHGADASGCVTRFQLKESVKYPQYPVELHFASEREVLLSLAVGYLSETTHVDKTGATRFLEPGNLREIAASIAKSAPRSAKPDKEAYKLLTEVLDVVDLLIDMDSPRYTNLRSEWASRRCTLLDNDALVSSTDNVVHFAAELLWDSWPNMTSLYKELSRKRALLGHKKIFCSIEMAALMLNISSASYYHESDCVRNLVHSCSLSDIGDGCMAMTKGGGTPLFRDDVDFALAQGLVSLIIVPLKKTVMEKSHPDVYNLLNKADIVDFPGVANEHTTAAPLTDDQLALNYTVEVNGIQKKPMLALTQVMKRGKTASIVLSSARDLNLDVFSLLMRMPAGPTYPSNPTQIMNGIRYWFKTMGKSHRPLSRDKDMQINLILTFSASLLNLVNASGTGPSGLIGVFHKLNSMGELADPEVVTPFCINYPMFPDGRINMESEARKREVLKQIQDDRHFKRLFKSTAESLNYMADLEDGQYGGRIYLFRQMLSQLGTSRRIEILERKKVSLEEEWNACMAEALPGSDSNSRSRDIETLINFITKNPRNLKDEVIARDILDFEDISPNVLEVPPRSDSAVKTYVKNQIVAWMEDAKRKVLQRNIGFENAEHRSRILSYLVEGLNTSAIEKWLSRAVKLLTPEERRESRRLVVTFLVKTVYPSADRHSAEEHCVKILERISVEGGSARREDDIYYISIIKPFLHTLERLKQADEGEKRGDQPGDQELDDICSMLNEAV